jgi:hypothetical protein
MAARRLDQEIKGPLRQMAGLFIHSMVTDIDNHKCRPLYRVRRAHRTADAVRSAVQYVTLEQGKRMAVFEMLSPR